MVRADVEVLKISNSEFRLVRGVEGSRLMTNPMGRSFLSYRRSNAEEAALLVEAQHDVGIPTWRDVKNLEKVPTADEIQRVLADTDIANAIL